MAVLAQLCAEIAERCLLVDNITANLFLEVNKQRFFIIHICANFHFADFAEISHGQVYGVQHAEAEERVLLQSPG